MWLKAWDTTAESCGWECHKRKDKFLVSLTPFLVRAHPVFLPRLRPLCGQRVIFCQIDIFMFFLPTSEIACHLRRTAFPCLPDLPSNFNARDFPPDGFSGQRFSYQREVACDCAGWLLHAFSSKITEVVCDHWWSMMVDEQYTWMMLNNHNHICWLFFEMSSMIPWLFINDLSDSRFDHQPLQFATRTQLLMVDTSCCWPESKSFWICKICMFHWVLVCDWCW